LKPDPQFFERVEAERRQKMYRFRSVLDPVSGDFFTPWIRYKTSRIRNIGMKEQLLKPE
jgi:hypothetical protein